MSDVDPAAIMADHARDRWGCFTGCDEDWPCTPYRLAEALAASEAKVARVEDLANHTARVWPGGELALAKVRDIRAAIADHPAQTDAHWSSDEREHGRWIKDEERYEDGCRSGADDHPDRL